MKNFFIVVIPECLYRYRSTMIIMPVPSQHQCNHRMGRESRKMLKNWIPAFAGMTTFLFLAVSNAFAMASRPNADPNAPPPPAWVQWFPMVVMVGVFYFLLIRPQMKQKRERDNMLNSMKKGDRVVTQGGLIVTIVNILPDAVEVKLNEETRAKVRRSAISEVLSPTSEVKEAEIVSKS